MKNNDTWLPQGTAFGPLSWIMSQNDMAYHVNVPTCANPNHVR